MNRDSGRLRPVKELVDAVSTMTGWGWLGDDGGDDSAPRRQPRGPGVLAIQSVIMIGVAAVVCLVKIAVYGGVAAAGWLVVFVPLALPVALATAQRPPRLALGLTVAGLAATAAGLLTVVGFHDYLTGFWLAFLGLSVAALVTATVFGFVTAAPRRTST